MKAEVNMNTIINELSLTGLIAVTSTDWHDQQNFALHTALTVAKNKSVLFFTKNRFDLSKRILSYFSDVGTYQFFAQDISETEFGWLMQAAEEIQDLPIIINDLQFLSLKMLQENVKVIKDEHQDLALIVMDNFGSLDFPNAIAELKKIATSLSPPILITLNSDKKGQHNADTFVFIDEGPKPTQATITITKPSQDIEEKYIMATNRCTGVFEEA